MKRIVVYDNCIKPNEIIREVIGDKGFGDVVVKRRKLSDTYFEKIGFLSPYVKISFDNPYDIEQFLEKAEAPEDAKVIHCFSDHIVLDETELEYTFQKLDFINENVRAVKDKRSVALMFKSISEYLIFLRKSLRHGIDQTVSEYEFIETPVDGVAFIGDIINFIQCITGNFDSRYFNSLKGDEFCIRKYSTNKVKIESEYRYWQLLPQNMKRWVVMPYDYKDDGERSSYAMERLYMTDVAIKWVHGSIGIDEFSTLCDMYFAFFNERSKKEITKEQYMSKNRELYVEKVRERIEDLKKLKEYDKIRGTIASDEHLVDIDLIFERYLDLKDRIEKSSECNYVSVIGHGDPCFANAMYNRSTHTLKFIDPKGALTEEELWTDPYYDIAKLSHSVCGNYDFFNNALFDINLDETFTHRINIPFDNSPYKDVFCEKVTANGYDYLRVRLYEASLFLSMLPLHIDYPHKVLGFIINAVNILDEIGAICNG